MNFNVCATREQVLHDAKKIMTLRLHARTGTEGPLWQHQFWDRFVRHAKEFAERLEYMHLNPVKKGLARRPEGWRWSSDNNFALDKATVAPCPIQIDCVTLPLGVSRLRKAHGQESTVRGYVTVKECYGRRPRRVYIVSYVCALHQVV